MIPPQNRAKLAVVIPSGDCQHVLGFPVDILEQPPLGGRELEQLPLDPIIGVQQGGVAGAPHQLVEKGPQVGDGVFAPAGRSPLSGKTTGQI